MAESTPRLEVVLGDLFDSRADILVVPCSTGGTMTREVARRVSQLGVKPPGRNLKPGQVVDAGTTDVHKVRQTVLFAAVVPAGDPTSAGIVESAARSVGSYLSAGLIAFPLLGTGAGELDPRTSLAAIESGFRNTTRPNVRARVYVIEQALFDKLRPGGPDPDFADDPAGLTPSVLTPSVSNAAGDLGAQTPVTAAALVLQILKHHKEYGGGTGSGVRMVPDDDAPRKRALDWLADVRRLFDPAKAPELHGRLVILGLCELDPPLRRALDSTGFYERLIAELRENLDDLRVSRPVPDENVPTHTDNPALVDELGRQGFARVLARRIRDAREEEAGNASRRPGRGSRTPRWRRRREDRGGAFLIHLHAPWGAGKTSLLNFLARALREPGRDGDRRYIAVTFNAWRHQRITPPWWWLMTTMYREAARELRGISRWRALGLRIREYSWRLKGGWPGFLALLIVGVFVVAVWKLDILDRLGGEDKFSLDAASGVVVAAAAIATPVLTLWGLVRGFGRWVLASSAQGARRFVDNTSDPMRVVHEHVQDLVRWIGNDVVVMIDDLDRCKAPYVVELLEGIQTLFRDVPVTYVVAADRDWLSDSYAAEYATFTNLNAQPGKPVGYLFLEKTFQISAGLPTPGDRIGSYWGRLLRSSTVPQDEELEDARTRADDELGGEKTADAGKKVHENPGATTADKMARREAVALEMVSERAQADHAHALEPFGSLLGHDPNPRAMKRLINAYGIARGCEILDGYNLEGDREKEQQSALWAILEMRWPRLSSYLASHPDDVGSIGNGERPAGAPVVLPDHLPAELKPLFGDAEVAAVVHGSAKDVHARLDADVLRSIPRR